MKSLIVFLTFLQIGVHRNPRFGLTLGFPEFLQGSLYLEGMNKALELGAGGFLLKNETIFTASINGYLYPQFRRFLLRGPFFSTGISYLRDENPNYIWKYLYLNLRVGNTVGLRRRSYFAYYLGASYQLYYKKIVKEEPGGWFRMDLNFPLIPSFGVKFVF